VPPNPQGVPPNPQGVPPNPQGVPPNPQGVPPNLKVDFKLPLALVNTTVFRQLDIQRCLKRRPGYLTKD